MDDKYYLTRTAAYVFLEKGGQYFYLRRKDTGWKDGRLTVPSGHVDKGETVKQAAVREAKEEAGVIVEEADLVFMQAQYLRDRYTYFYFVTNKWKGEPKVNETHLASECLWDDKNRERDDFIPYLRLAVNNYQRGIFFSEVEKDID